MENEKEQATRTGPKATGPQDTQRRSRQKRKQKRETSGKGESASLPERLREAVDYCKENGILTDFLAGREEEVVDVICSTFIRESVQKAYGNYCRQEGKEEMACNMARDGICIDEIAGYAGVTVDTVRQWLEEAGIPEPSAPTPSND